MRVSHMGRSTHFNPRSSCEERRWRSSGSVRASHFNPRSSCEERQRHADVVPEYKDISIHAPHARSDAGSADERVAVLISIHAPHARSDDPIIGGND